MRSGVFRSAVVAALLAPSLAVAQAPVTAESSGGADYGEADFDWSLRGLDGHTFRLDRYRGRPLVLNIWATWCAPCVAELSSLERLAESLTGTGIELLAVSPEPAARVRSFLRRYGYALPVAVEDQRMPESFGLRALPTTYVLDGRGRIVLVHRGAAEWDRLEVRTFLLGLLR